MKRSSRRTPAAAAGRSPRLASSAFRKALAAIQEVTITVTGRRSGRKSSRPVWFVADGERLYLLPVNGAETQWYKNVRRIPTVSLRARRSRATVRARPVTDATRVRRIVRQFRAKYGPDEIKKYYSRLDVGLEVRLPPEPGSVRARPEGTRSSRRARR
jgi:deazaflavin-dependent oxidoreductase (nitroreductase family)